jgi:6-phosphogluconolactonase
MRAYDLLGPLLEDWSAVHFWYGDERCVEPDDPDSNHGQTIARLVAPGASFHRMRGEVGPSQGAREYLAELGDTVMDLTLLGMGPDGHTASLFPNHLLLAASAAVVPITDSPKPPPQRITLTLATINASRAILLAVTGADKAPALARALGNPDPGTPVSLLARDRLEIVCDEAAW